MSTSGATTNYLTATFDVIIYFIFSIKLFARDQKMTRQAVLYYNM